MMDKVQLKKFEAHMRALLFNENGELDRKLKLAAFYILCAEELRAAIVDKALSFFDFEGNPGSKAELPEGLKNLGSPKPDKRLKAAVEWFADLSAFDDDDKDLVRLAMDYRNNAAHELQRLLWDHTKDHFSEWVPFGMIVLTNKINKWWIQNFEAAVDPAGFSRYSEVDLEAAETVSASFTRNLFFAAFPAFAEELRAAAFKSGG